VHGVFFFPGRGLHFLKTGTHDHLDAFAAKPARGAATVHGRVAAAENDHALSDLVGVAERNAGEPVDADVDIGGGFLAAGNIEFAAARRARADKDRIVVVGKQLLHAVDARAAFELDPKIEDVIRLFVNDGIGQAEFWNLRPHHAAGFRIGIEYGAMIAER